MIISPKHMKRIENFAFEKAKKQDYNHDKEHVVRTARLAWFIAKKERANQEVCYVAALLHDVAKDIKHHEAVGAQMASDFLKKSGFPDAFIEKVSHAIKYHGYKDIHKARTPEAKIVFDADKLQMIGPYSFCRVLSDFLVKEKHNLKDAVRMTKKAQETRFNKLQTRTARQIMKKDHEFMKRFYELYDKWDVVKL